MSITRRRALHGAAALGAMPLMGRMARAQGKPDIRIGVLTDLSGPYRDVGGPTGVACVRQAIEDFKQINPGLTVELVSADHQNKADIGASIARQWFDRENVDAIVGCGNTAVALACRTIVEEKDKVQLNTEAGSSDLTGKYCSPNLIHWTYDSWFMAKSTGGAITKAGGKKWYFITPDYSFGHAVENDTKAAIEALGGQLAGHAVYPFPGTTDFSSALIQATSSGADVLGLANAGTDVVNTIKQAQEFGVTTRMKLAAMVCLLTDVHAMGLGVAQNILLSETFYWDLNDGTRKFTSRVKPKLSGVYPNMNQASGYSATLHYLKSLHALGAAGLKASGREVVAAMKRQPTDDDCFGPGQVRADGRKISPGYLFQVKTPAESKGEWDLYKLVATTPADQAFRPLNEGGCKLAT